MPIDPINAALDVLSRDSRLGMNASDTVNYLMDLLYYGEFSIFEQVSSAEMFERVNLVGVKGNYGDADPLWLVSTINSGVDPVPSIWASTDGSPLTPRRHDAMGRLFGLGACSGKVDMVLKILAASRFRAEELRRPIYLVSLSGEEPHGTGLRSLLNANLNTAGAALLHAPTNLEAWTDHPGCITIRLELTRRLRHRRMPPCRGFFQVEVSGRSAHAQHADLGVNALDQGLEVLDALKQAGDLRILSFDAGEAANRVPGRCRLQVATSYDTLPQLPAGARGGPISDGTALPFPVDAMFDAWFKARTAGVEAVTDQLGTARNQRVARPRNAFFTGQVKTGRDTVGGTVMLWTGPGVDTPTVVEAFASAVQHALKGMDELEVGIQVLQDRPAFAGAEGSEAFASVVRGALAEVGLPPVMSGGRLTTDAAFMRNLGIQTLVFGPGRGAADLYRDDESITIDHLRTAYRFYERLIAAWCVEQGDRLG